jgi:hypothetical protein
MTNVVNASVIRVVPDNYGTIQYNIGPYNGYIPPVESTNTYNLPYMDSISLNGWGFYQAVLEINTATIVSAPYYYLELSPWSAWSGVAITKSVTISQFNGNGGPVTLADYNAGVAVGTVEITSPDSGLWYTQNSIGGYLADSYFDITSLITDAQKNNQNFLGINISTPDRPVTGILFRQPAILASSTNFNVAAVPVPAAAWLFLSGLMGVLSINRRKNKTANLIAA